VVVVVLSMISAYGKVRFCGQPRIRSGSGALDAGGRNVSGRGRLLGVCWHYGTREAHNDIILFVLDDCTCLS